ncbi:MAG: site-2 protease family protein [Bacteriovoracaceae bacterium]|nr:site-2 protease family protein [Bacteroidota bacterium]
MTLQKILIHSGLFIATFFTTTVAGVSWLNIDPFDLSNFVYGLPYSIGILFILSCHEFGHYFAARYHGVNATLPYYIPTPSLPGFLNFGTFGAVIKTLSPVPSKKVMFDIGVAGPIAGFIATVGLLMYGFTHLPGKEFILQIHPEYFTQESQGIGLRFGSSLLYDFFSIILTDGANDFVPPMTEMYHYPFLITGWFGLFVTAMNLIPVGQLDGGHLSYTMFGDRHRIVSRISFGIIFIIGAMGFLPLLGIETTFGWSGWIFWTLILLFVVKLYHPPVEDETELDPTRRLIGWLTFGILAVSFSPSPFNL